MVLTKHRTIIKRIAKNFSDVLYAQDVDPGEYPGEYYYCSLELYEELGEPETITITIEPGDKPNG